MLLLHDGEREEVLEGGDVEAGVQHQGHLLELNHVARLVRVIRQAVEPHLVLFCEITNSKYFFVSTVSCLCNFKSNQDILALSS